MVVNESNNIIKTITYNNRDSIADLASTGKSGGPASYGYGSMCREVRAAGRTSQVSSGSSNGFVISLGLLLTESA